MASLEMSSEVSSVRRYIVGRHMRRAAILVAILVGIAGCGTTAGPTTPSSTAPLISTVLPVNAIISQNAQAVSVTGLNFRSSMTLIVTRPDGTVLQLSGPDLLAMTSTSFQFTLTFEQGGAYRLTLNDLTGGKSNEVLIVVQGSSTTPVIVGVLPASPTRSPGFQVLGIQGVSFVSGLLVTASDPSGIPVTNTVLSAQPTQIEISVLLQKPGTYVVVVTNPSGETSNAFAFTVQ